MISETPTRSRLTIAFLAIGLIIAVCCALLFPVPFHGRMATALGDLVHAPLFAALTIGGLSAWHWLSPLAAMDASADMNRDLRIRLKRAFSISFALSLFGLSMEFLQQQTGRSASWHDATANCLGIASAVAIYFAFSFQRIGKLGYSILCSIACITGMGLAWARPITVLVDVANVSRQFPLLASFESDAEITRWYFRNAGGRRVRRDATDGDHAFQAEFRPAPLSVITLSDLVNDWRQYSYLEFDIALDADYPASTCELFVNVVDFDGQDYRDFRVLIRAERSVAKRARIPFVYFESSSGDRFVDWQNIRYLDIGIRESNVKTRIRIDRLKLTQ